jgi:hypothetical protein
MERIIRLLRQVVKFYCVYHTSENKHKKELLNFIDKIEEQFSLNSVGCSFCDEIPKDSFYLGKTCEQCNKPFRVVKTKK